MTEPNGWIPFDEIIGFRDLLQKFMFRYRRYHAALKVELGVWLAERPPFYIVRKALNSTVYGTLKHAPMGYMRKIISIEWQNYNERRWMETHDKIKREEEKKTQEAVRGGDMATAGSVVDSIMAGIGRRK